jgi:hypothetical protein
VTRRILLPALLAGLAGVIPLALAGPAAAASGSRFSCRASAARVILLGGSPLEPVVANAANDACASEIRSSGPPQTGGALSLGAAQAATVDQGQGTASARVADVGVNLGPTLLPLKIGVSGVNASASYACQGAGLVFAGSSQVLGITINGAQINIPDKNAPVDIELGDLLTIHLNQTLTTTTGDLTEVTRRAVDIESKLLATQIVLGEARAGVAGNPCAQGASVPTPTSTQVTVIKVPVPSGSIAGISPGITPGACATKPFIVTVRGRGIARTVFSVDGKIVKRVGKTDTPRLALNPATVAIGLHRVKALVSYTNTKIRPKTLSFVFGRCGAEIPTTAQFGKCVNVRITNTRPGKVFVGVFSGPKSVRVFGGHLYTFTAAGTRIVCLKIPLKARSAHLRTTRTFTVAIRVGGTRSVRTIRVS